MFAIRRFTLKMVHETGKNSTKSINSFSTTAQIVPNDSKSSNAAASYSYEVSLVFRFRKSALLKSLFKISELSKI